MTRAGGTQITLGGELRVRGWWFNNIQGGPFAGSTISDAMLFGKKGLSEPDEINVTPKKDESINHETEKKDNK